MFGGLGGMDPSKMKAVMKQLGIKQEEINAERVVVECSDRKIIIDEPSVQKIIMQGQESWQIVGKAREESLGIREEDIALVVEKSGKSKVEAKKALEVSGGDIAEAILSLS